MILLSHPTGNANVRQSLTALEEANLLGEFWTSIIYWPDSTLTKLIPSKISREMARRTFPSLSPQKAHCLPIREIIRLLLIKTNVAFLTQQAHSPFSADAVFAALDKRVSKHLNTVQAIKAVYSGEDCAYHTFNNAKHLNISCVYDLPAAYWRTRHQIYLEEKEREPEWASSLSGLHDSQEKLHKKDEELRLADVIFVSSSFTQKSLAPVSEKLRAKVQLVPYGTTNPVSDSLLLEVLREPKGSKRLKILFVGALGQNKGLAYLLRAIEPIQNFVDLTLIGRVVDPNIYPLAQALKKHRWIDSLPNDAVLNEMRRHDVLVLPSLNEGFGLVILEAMGQGTPVITTQNTGGPDIISHGNDGFIVPIRSADAITGHLVDLLSSSPERLKELRFASLNKARLFTWERYRTRLVTALNELLFAEHGP